MARSLRPSSGSASGAIRMLERTGLRKGVGGNRAWFYVGTGLWTLRTVRRLAERREELLLSEPLEPGQRIVIANGRATIDDGQQQMQTVGGSRRARKRARKAADASS